MMKTRFTPKGYGGFTLAEMLVVLVILSVIILGITALWFSQFRVIRQSSVLAETHREASIVLSRISEIVSQGVAIQQSATIDGEQYFTDDDTLIVSLAAIDEHGNVISGQYDQVVIFITNGTLKRKVEKTAESTRFISDFTLDDVVDLLFTYEDSDELVQSSWIDVALTRRTKLGGDEQHDISVKTKIVIKNKP